MDSNWRPNGGDPTAAAAGPDPIANPDWRSQLQPEARHRIVNKKMDTITRHLPVPVPEGLSELHKIAVRFEEKIYSAATSQPDYLRKISLKMLSKETNAQGPQINSGANTNLQNQTHMDPGLGGMQSQAGTNPAQSLAMPVLSQPPTSRQMQQQQQPLIPQNFQNNSTAPLQASADMPNSLNQSVPAATQSTPGMNSMSSNTMAQPVGPNRPLPTDMYANAQRRQQAPQQQQPQQSQLVYQQMMRQKLQQRQQQGLLQQTPMQMSSGLTGQSVMQPNAMTAGMTGGMQVQQNQLNPLQQQALLRHQQQQQQNSSMGNHMSDLQQQRMQMQQNQMQQNQIPHNQIPQSQMLNAQNMMSSQQNQMLGNGGNMASIQQPLQQRRMQMNPQMQPQQQQHLLSQFQSQQQPMQQQGNMMQMQQPQRGMQGSAAMIQTQNGNINNNVTDQQKQFMQQQQQQQQQQRVIQDVASSPASMDSTAQTGAPNELAVEEMFQKVKSMKEQYFMDLREIHQRLSMKLNQIDPNLMADIKAAEQIDKMKNFKNVLERMLNILQLNKQTLQHQVNMKDKLQLYEKQMLSILQSHKKVLQQQQQQLVQQQQMPPSQPGSTDPQQQFAPLQPQQAGPTQQIENHQMQGGTANFNMQNRLQQDQIQQNGTFGVQNMMNGMNPPQPVGTGTSGECKICGGCSHKRRKHTTN